MIVLVRYVLLKSIVIVWIRSCPSWAAVRGSTSRPTVLVQDSFLILPIVVSSVEVTTCESRILVRSEMVV